MVRHGKARPGRAWRGRAWFGGAGRGVARRGKAGDIMTITIRVPGEPQGKGRPRISTRGGMVRNYTPEKSRNYSALIAMAGQSAMNGLALLEGPVAVIVSASFSVPTSFSKNKRLDALGGVVHPVKKPDIDNIAKHFDALNGIVWLDDKQIVDCTIRKFYASQAMLEIQVRAL